MQWPKRTVRPQSAFKVKRAAELLKDAENGQNSFSIILGSAADESENLEASLRQSTVQLQDLRESSWAASI